MVEVLCKHCSCRKWFMDNWVLIVSSERSVGMMVGVMW